MRTAAALIVLTGNTRPRARAVLESATAAFDRLTAGTAPLSGIRFTGYMPAADYDIPTGARVARYERDYADT